MPVDDSATTTHTGLPPVVRQPPRFVPTLTEVVTVPARAAEPSAFAQSVLPRGEPEAPHGETGSAGGEQVADEVGALGSEAVQIASILQRLADELEPRLVSALDRQLQVLGQTLVRQALATCMQELEPELREVVRRAKTQDEAIPAWCTDTGRA